MVDVEQLLAPVSEESPCGEDLSYDPDLSALESLIQGKAETQFSEAEEPNWKEVQKAALALAERTRDLRVTIDLTLGLLKLDGWPGFAQGTALLRGLHERYWAEFYPRLDPDDDNDPTERTNVLATMAAPEGTFGDPMRFVERLRGAPLCQGARMGPLPLSAIGPAVDGTKKAAAASGDESAGEPAAAGPDRATIAATFRDTPAEFLAGVRSAVEGATADVVAIDEFWDSTVGGGRGPNLETLKVVLRDAKNRLDAFAPVVTEETGGSTGDDPDLLTGDVSEPTASSPRSRGEPNGVSAPGEIASRQDVLGALDAICAYYDDREPSSPVPALLRQARKMVGMNYFQLVSALTPDATPQVKLSADDGDSTETPDATSSDDLTSAL